MTCTTCGFANAEGMRFCGQCGARLSPSCPGCGAENPPEMRFCGHCGTRLSEGVASAAVAPASGAGPAAAGEPAPFRPVEPTTERRLVSVLFADIVGFTTRSDAADPEQVREFQSRYFETCREVVERYDGTVEKFIGDAVMASGGRRSPWRTTPSARSARAWSSSMPCASSASGSATRP